MNRRTLLQASLAGLLGARFPGLATAAFAQDARPFSFDGVIARARAASGCPTAGR